MTEIPSRSESLSCAQCGVEIGRIVAMDGEDLVQVGGLIVAEIAGNCTTCGQAFHYSVNARRLEQLVSRVLARRRSEEPYDPACT